jgi:hypothetical protein
VAIIVAMSLEGAGLEPIRRALILWLPLEAALVTLQTTTSYDSIWNKVDSAEYVSLFTADGVVRASGTFTSALGLSLYLVATSMLLLPVVLNGTARGAAKTGGLLAFALIVVTTALCGSRTAVVSVALIVAAVIMASLLGFAEIHRGIATVLGLILLIAVASQIFPSVLAAFGERFQSAAASEDTNARLSNSALEYLDHWPPHWLGEGMGSHLQAGIAAGSPGPWIEQENLRVVAELGVLGWLICVLRTIIAIALAVVGLTSALRRRSLIVVATAAAAVPILAVGSFTTQPSVQGFGGIILGAFLSEVFRPNAAALPAQNALPRSTTGETVAKS